ncbi:MAG: peptidoglycan-binding protein [Minisyncoccia bacterium]
MKNKLKLFAMAMFMFFGVVGLVGAAALNWSVDQTINLTSPDIDLTIASGSAATSLVVNAGDIDVVLGAGDVFTVTPVSGALTVSGNTTATVSNVCTAGISTVVLTGGAGGETITITPTGVACVAPSTGGGGSGTSSGSRPRTTTPPIIVPPTPIPTPTPIVTNEGGTCTYNLGTEVLKNGSRGEAVKELQRFMNAEMNLGLVMDGILGPKTIAVIMKWQTENSLVSDGLIGPMTKAKMNGIAATRCATPATPATPGETPATPATPNAQGYAFGTLLVKEGTKGESCKAWQMFLNDKTNAGLVADGNCGPKTMVAAKAWQASVGLTADGMLGAMSRTKALTQ